MSLDLLNELEKRVQSAVSTIEDLKLEIEQLKEENAELISEKDAWEGRLAELLGKFDLIDSADSDMDAASSETQADTDTLANQAFEQDFAESDEETGQNSFGGNNSF